MNNIQILELIYKNYNYFTTHPKILYLSKLLRMRVIKNTILMATIFNALSYMIWEF